MSPFKMFAAFACFGLMSLNSAFAGPYGHYYHGHGYGYGYGPPIYGYPPVIVGPPPPPIVVGPSYYPPPAYIAPPPVPVYAPLPAYGYGVIGPRGRFGFGYAAPGVGLYIGR